MNQASYWSIWKWLSCMTSVESIPDFCSRMGPCKWITATDFIGMGRCDQQDYVQPLSVCTCVRYTEACQALRESCARPHLREKSLLLFDATSQTAPLYPSVYPMGSTASHPSPCPDTGWLPLETRASTAAPIAPDRLQAYSSTLPMPRGCLSTPAADNGQVPIYRLPP